jgi:LCP family protein required for cell wall assembly
VSPFRRDPERPPRPGRGVLWRAALVGAVTIALSAAAVTSAALLEIDDVTKQFIGPQPGRTAIDIPEVTRAQAGDPRTFLILGSDGRYGDKQAGVKPRSDTILLARVDPDSKRIAVMSIPRDLKVQIPGYGTDKINAAYEVGGPRKTVATVKRLFRDATGADFPINNVINVNFNGFQKAVNYVGGVYVDVDRRYYNDNTTAAYGEGYAAIDVQPGYQLLKGSDALAYVRYRHGDSDIFRSSRQQDFLRQITHQDGVRKLLDVGKRKELAKIFGNYFQVDKSFVSKSNILALARMGLFLASSHAPVNEVRFPFFEAPDPKTDTYLYFKPSDLRKTVSEFMTGAGSLNPRPAATATATPQPAKKAKRAKPAKPQNKASAIAGLEQDRVEGENMAVLAVSTPGQKLGFPFYFPALRRTGARYVANAPRVYKIPDERGAGHEAYRLVLYTGSYGDYYGVQGTTWRDPPILDDPDRTRVVNHRKLRLYYDGSHLRLVGWKTPKGAYWVTNTLDQSISNSQLIGIAGSLTRLK